MQRFEYKVVPAPRRGEKARGVKSAEERFALALSRVMNDLGAEGWDYVRADALPCDERSGLTGTKTTFQNMLVFRRAVEVEAPRAPLFGRSAAPAAEVAAPVLAKEAAPVSAPVAATAPVAPPVLPPVLAAPAAAPANHAPALGPPRSEFAAE